MSNEKFYDQARVAFKKLRAEPGNIIFVIVPADTATVQMQAVMDQLQRVGAEHDVSTMVVRAGTNITELNEEQMAQHGWFKHGRIN